MKNRAAPRCGSAASMYACVNGARVGKARRPPLGEHPVIIPEHRRVPVAVSGDRVRRHDELVEAVAVEVRQRGREINRPFPELADVDAGVT